MRDDTQTIKSLTAIASDLVHTTREVSLARSSDTRLFYKTIMRLAVCFLVGIAMLVGCIVYALYQAYNYEGYSTNPTTIENNNITGKDNKIDKGGSK